jgi:hypothetical protein
MVRALFRLASLLYKLQVLSSGNPSRIAKYYVRRSAIKRVGRAKLW